MIPTKTPAPEGAWRRGGGKPRGFATMPHAQVVSIARLGGKASQALGVAHRFTTEEAAAAGRKGGLRSRRGPSKPKAQEEATEEETGKPQQG